MVCKCIGFYVLAGKAFDGQNMYRLMMAKHAKLLSSDLTAYREPVSKMSPRIHIVKILVLFHKVPRD